jgi:hypothetical protein
MFRYNFILTHDEYLSNVLKIFKIDTMEKNMHSSVGLCAQKTASLASTKNDCPLLRSLCLLLINFTPLQTENISSTCVPAYPLIQYPRFTAARKKWKTCANREQAVTW